ncbi:hypothetical protein SPRG_17605 [Saprolegnia parasitica CBS 223.65]|uniref:WRKY19-like zinc finger domain-containing protein n=1 Tax=Saprolegnia parasitica (strain CBS 223.65) TaxID=695850 RepID=A0A067BEX6_SAPPC|nr:hypothetical protein SPRG_17605 [Saprolegnia parasitica CBS 223.65]KDO16939.1 hypothetical protein SPRG_17605 [Saprolegnia parasitica CBS 223.65]|eukprot:XP_012212354.1 hypothetical protein SPRG_17605 [Saprolegnia parasitica CBS 223.65]
MAHHDPKAAATRRALCQFKGCTKFAQTRGRCKAHGGGTRCKVEACIKLAQSRGHCIAHGGGRKCHIESCDKLAQSKGYCIAHGGGRKCAIDGCEKFSQIKGKCKAHAKTSPPSTPHSPPLLHPLPPLTHAKVSALQMPSTISLSPLRDCVRRPEATTCSFAALFEPSPPTA